MTAESSDVGQVGKTKRPWYRLHASTWLIALIGIGVFVTWNVSGFIRTTGQDPMSQEWQNGWPLVYMQRVVGFHPPYDEDTAIPMAQIRFDPVMLLLDGTLGLILVAVGAWIVERRRRRRGRFFQYSLKALFAAMLLASAVLGWGLLQQHGQKQIAEQLAPCHFGYSVDQGTPTWLRRQLPGGRLRPFDRIACVQLMGPECHGEQLAPMAKLRTVKVVEIMSDHLDDEGLSYLRALRHLVSLSVPVSRVSDVGLAHLAGLTQMQRLSISGTKITDRGLDHLMPMVHLETLELHAPQISDVGVAQLRGLSSLKLLSLTNNAALSDDALVHLAKLEKLEILTLGGTGVTNAGLSNLASLEHLKLLDLRNTQVTVAGVVKLQRALPKCRIVF